MENDFLLSTSDNPFCPFYQFNDWLRFDEDSQYFTLSYLASIARTSDDLSDEDNDRATLSAMNDILQLNLTGNYIKVFRPKQTLAEVA